MHKGIIFFSPLIHNFNSQNSLIMRQQSDNWRSSSRREDERGNDRGRYGNESETGAQRNFNRYDDDDDYRGGRGESGYRGEGQSSIGNDYYQGGYDRGGSGYSGGSYSSGGNRGSGNYGGSGDWGQQNYSRNQDNDRGFGGGTGNNSYRDADAGGIGNYGSSGMGNNYAGGSRGNVGSGGMGNYGSGGGMSNYGGNYGQSNRGSDWNSGGNYGQSNRGGDWSSGGNYGQSNRGNSGQQDRGWWDKTRDEMSSWFGDDDAERRRRMDRMEGQHRGKGPKNYQRSEERIREDISDRLSDDDSLDASDIEIKVSGSEVTLSGTVETRLAKRRAEDIAEAVSGVSNVQNQLRVGQSNSGNTGQSSSNSGDASSSASKTKSTTSSVGNNMKTEKAHHN
jgi:osmotically-inducible protein OsmY